MSNKDFFNWVNAAKQSPEHVDYMRTMKMNDPLTQILENEKPKEGEIPLVKLGPDSSRKDPQYSKMVYASVIPKKNKGKANLVDKIIKILGGLRNPK